MFSLPPLSNEEIEAEIKAARQERAHGARHSWFRLKWLVDLPYVLQSKAWDWPALFAKARRIGCADALRLGLILWRKFRRG